MNEIETFKNEEFGEVRTVIKDGIPWLVGKDIAMALGYKDPKDAISSHCKGAVKYTIPTAGGMQAVNIIPESDLYRLIMRSKLPSAEKFQDWVCCEVLPSIRKTGKYELTPKAQLLECEIISRELKAATDIAKIFGLEGNQMLLSANTLIKNKYDFDCMKSIELTGLVSESKEQYVTPTILGKDIGLSAVKINQKIESLGFQTKTRDHKNKIVWLVTEEGKPLCEMIDTNKKHNNGSPILQIKWSTKIKEII